MAPGNRDTSALRCPGWSGELLLVSFTQTQEVCCEITFLPRAEQPTSSRAASVQPSSSDGDHPSDECTRIPSSFSCRDRVLCCRGSHRAQYVSSEGAMIRNLKDLSPLVMVCPFGQ